MNDETMVVARDLVKTYHQKDGEDVPAVQGIDLDIRRGEIFSLLGPNGAGKSTTIAMISGLIAPTRGEVWIGGYSMRDQAIQAKQLLGVIPQEVALYPSLSARQNLEFFGRMYGLRGKELSLRVDEILEFIGLIDRQKGRIETFSGGMKRRVNIGVGLLHRPELVYMDEPTVGIDPQSRRSILDTVQQLRDEHGTTILYTTHLMEEAQELSDRVAIIDFGKIIALGTQDELTQLVGEEDNLIFNVGDQSIADDLLETIRTRISGVSQAYFDPPGVRGENPANTSGELVISAKRGRKALPEVIRMTNEVGIEIASVEVREPDLEAVFLNLTGRALRN
jgi:linearmycin/streptolysin S transport system ATP-binding protein